MKRPRWEVLEGGNFICVGTTGYVERVNQQHHMGAEVGGLFAVKLRHGAAPDMLDALRMAINPRKTPAEKRCAIEAAIAKATKVTKVPTR